LGSFYEDDGLAGFAPGQDKIAGIGAGRHGEEALADRIDFRFYASAEGNRSHPESGCSVDKLERETP